MGLLPQQLITSIDNKNLIYPPMSPDVDIVYDRLIVSDELNKRSPVELGIPPRKCIHGSIELWRTETLVSNESYSLSRIIAGDMQGSETGGRQGTHTVLVYDLYWGSSEVERLAEQRRITSIESKSPIAGYRFTSGSLVPIGATHILVYLRNSHGLSHAPKAIPLADRWVHESGSGGASIETSRQVSSLDEVTNSMSFHMTAVGTHIQVSIGNDLLIQTPIAKKSGSAYVILDKQLLIMGGHDQNSGRFSSSVESCQVDTNKLTDLALYSSNELISIDRQNDIDRYLLTPAELPKPLAFVSASSLGGNILIVGGSSSGEEYSGDVYIYHWRRKTWEKKPSLNEPRRKAISVAHDRYVYVFGGETASGVTSSVERLDVLTSRWVPCKRMPEPRKDGVAVWMNGNIYLVGGYNDLGDPIDRVDRYIP